MKTSIIGPRDPALGVVVDIAEDRPDLDLEIAVIPWAEYHDVLMAALTAKTAPRQAVFVPGNAWIPGLARDGLLADLEPLLKQLPAETWHAYQPDDVIEHVAAESRYEGGRYSIPMFTDGHLLFYRSDLLSLGHKGNPPEVSPLELGEIAALVHKPPQTYGLALKAHPSEILFDWFPYFFEAGGVLIDGMGQPAFASEAGVRALQYYCGLRVYCPPDTDQYGNEQIARVMKAGKAALVANWGGQAAPILLDERNPYRLRYQAAVYAHPCGATWGIAIARNQPERRQLETLGIVLELTGPKQDLEIIDAAGSPVRHSSYTEDRMARYPWLRAQYAVSQRLALLPRLPEMVAFFGPLAGAVTAAFAGKAEPEDALQKAESEVRAAIQ